MRQLTKVLFTGALFAFSGLTISGCAGWPPRGQGGMAEHDLSVLPNHPLGPEHGLYFEQDLSRRHLDTLVLAGADICFPASVSTAKQRQDRISREIQGGLNVDATNDLIIQRDKLAALERRLDYVKQQGSCSNPNNGTMGSGHNSATLPPPLTNDKINYIQSLLNNNNQFALDSSQLNPRYIAHLAEAAILLRAQPEYHLKITGHTDSKGNNADNLQLSLERAKQVARYLQIFGLDPSSIMIDANGEENPVFPGSEPHIRLVNRRVNIELIDVNHSAPLTMK